ncbi:MAG TPA: hypothetical protein VFI65_04435 [Streptosporangiaceae bacterium]|nr:hypothetical protein [Streptosporangiaceae bacterium]
MLSREARRRRYEEKVGFWTRYWVFGLVSRPGGVVRDNADPQALQHH